MSDAKRSIRKIDGKAGTGQLEKSLKEFGISLEDLVLSSPKHKDSRLY